MKLYYEDHLVSLWLGSCLDGLPRLDIANSLVIADPPYGQTSLEWDHWPSGWPSVIPDSVRSMWCFGSLRMFMLHHAQMERGGWKFSQDLVWEKHNGSSFHADRFRRIHESICHFYRGEWSSLPVFPPTTNDATRQQLRRKQRPTHMGHIEAGAYLSEDGGPRIMRSVLFHRSMHGDAVHPTQKPVELIKPLIHYGGYGDATVIVPFAGAGSELVAAKEMGRHAIGFESREEYCEIAAQRASQVLPFTAAAGPSQSSAS